MKLILIFLVKRQRLSIYRDSDGTGRFVSADLYVACHTIGHVQTDLVFPSTWCAMTHACASQWSGRRLNRYCSSRQNGLIGFHQHAKLADIDGTSCLDLVLSPITPAEINLAVDGNALMQPTIGAGFRCRRTGLACTCIRCHIHLFGEPVPQPSIT